MPTPDSHLVDQAIQWMIKLRYNTADDASTAAFEQWLHTSDGDSPPLADDHLHPAFRGERKYAGRRGDVLLQERPADTGTGELYRCSRAAGSWR